MFSLKYNYGEGAIQNVDLSLIIRSRQNAQAIQKPKQAFTSKIIISKAKFLDLKKMCDKGVIPEHFASEYLNLPYHGSVRDSLPETDVEEEESRDN